MKTAAELGIVLPVIRSNSTSQDELTQQLCDVIEPLREAREWLVGPAWPKRIDYCAVAGLFRRAMTQHRRRLRIIDRLIEEFESQMRAIEHPHGKIKTPMRKTSKKALTPRLGFR